MRRLLILLAFLLLPSLAAAQNAQYQQILLGSTGKPIAGAQVYVCSDPGTDPLPIPCAPTVNIFSDVAGSTSKSNPFTSDSLGNISFFAPPANYVISVIGTGLTPQSYRVTLPCVQSSSCGGGGGGGGGAPGGTLPGDVQTRVDATTFGTATMNDTTTLGVTYKGPNPEYNIAAYGNYYTTSTLVPISGSINAGSSTLTLSSPSDFANLHGIRIDHAGPGPLLSTPSAGTCVVKGIINGTTIHTYQVFAEDANGATTASASACSTSTAPSTLGPNSATVTQGVLANGVITYTTSANHNFEAGRPVAITGFSGGYFNAFNGTYIIATTPSPTTFTVNTPSSVQSLTDTSGGTAKVNGYVRVTWNFQANAVRSWICRDGTLVGVAQGADPVFMDYGNDLGTFSFMAPYYSYIPKTCPATAQNGFLSALVTSGGGTNVLILSAPATNTVTSQSVIHDNTPLLVAAENAMVLNPTNSITSGTLVIPNMPNNNTKSLVAPFGVYHAFTTTAGQTKTLLLRGWPNIGLGWTPSQGMTVIGAPGSTGAVSFNTGTTQGIYGGYPLFLLKGQNNVTFRNMTFNAGLNQQSAVVSEPTAVGAQSGYGINFDTTSCIGTPNSDSCYVQKAGAFSSWKNTHWGIEGNPQSGLQPPAVRLTVPGPALGPTPISGAVKTSDINYCIGSCISIDTYYNDTVTAGGSTGTNDFANILTESLQGPAISILVGNSFYSMLHTKMLAIADPLASIGTPAIELGNSLNINNVTIEDSDTNNQPLINGAVLHNLQINTYRSGTEPINSSSYRAVKPSASNSELATAGGTGSVPQLELLSNSPILLKENSASFVGASIAAPTVAPTLTGPSAGGSVPVATHTYSCTVVGWNGGESKTGPTASITTTGGNQTVTITSCGSLPTGGRGFYIQRDGSRANMPVIVGSGNCSTAIATSFPVTDTSAVNCGNGPPQDNFAASQYMNPVELGASQLQLGGKRVTSFTGNAASVPTTVAGSITGTSASVCTDALGNLTLTTAGCTAGGSFYQTVIKDGTSQTQRNALEFVTGSNMTINCADSSSPSKTSCTFTSTSTGATAFSALTASTNSNAGTFAASGNVWDFGAATSLKVPTSSGAAPTANGLLAYDSTANKWVFGQNSGTVSFGLASSACASHFFVDTPATATAAAVCHQPNYSDLAGTPVVQSVFGRTGAVTATIGDYLCSQITNGPCLNAANTFTAGNKNIFTANATNAGFNLANVSGQPSSPTSGDFINNSNVPQFYNGAAWKSLAFTDSNITGNAATATALAANGTNCASGSPALGVDASGNAEGCNPLTAAQVTNAFDRSTNNAVGAFYIEFATRTAPSAGSAGTCRVYYDTTTNQMTGISTLGSCFSSGGGGGGANTQLSNLGSTAINANMLPGTDNSIDLGSGSLRWKDIYFGGSLFSTGTGPVSLQGNTGSCTGASGKGTFCFSSTGNRPRYDYNLGGFANLVLSGVDIDTLDRVTSTHLSSALPINQGGTGITDFAFTGTSHTMASSTGTLTSGRTAAIDANGNIVQGANVEANLNANAANFTAGNLVSAAGTHSTQDSGIAAANAFHTGTPANTLEGALSCQDGGSTDAYSCSLTPAIASYATGAFYAFKANTVNTGAATLNLNGLGAKTIKKLGGSADLADADIAVGQWVIVQYDGTNMQMQSQIANSSAGSGTVTTSGTPGANNLTCFSGSTVITNCNLSGDATTSGTGAVTVTKINGTSFAGTNGNLVSFGASNVPADAGFLASNVVRKDTTNTGGASMTLDMSASTSFRVPNSAGFSSTTAGAFGYDTTNKMPHVGANGVDNLISLLPSSVTPSNNDCVKFSVSSGVITLNTSGAACATTGGNTTSTSLVNGNIVQANGANSIIDGGIALGNVTNNSTNFVSGGLVAGTGNHTLGATDLTGDVTTAGGVTTTIAANAVTAAKSAVVLTRRVCDMAIGDTSASSALTNAQLGPQKRMCFIPYAATVVEIDVAADGGTPNVIVGRNRAGSTSNLLSSALATAASGGIACSNTGGTTGLDGTTTCSSTLQNTSTNAGDYFELVSGTAGGTAKFMTVHVVYTVN